MSSWHKYGGIGHDSKFKNLMSNNLASNEIAKMNKLYANNICVANDVDVSGHSQLCDVSACNVDISGNLRVDASVNFTNARKIFMQQGNIILDEQGEIGIGKDVFTLPRNGAYNNIGIGQEALKECTGNNCIDNVAVEIGRAHV